jgi:hypothetical protein
MSATLVTFKDLSAGEPVLDVNSKKGLMGRNWLLWILGLSKRFQLIKVDTSLGNEVFTLGPSAKNQGVEVVVKKVTPDVNTVTLAAFPGDTLDEVAILTTSTGATAKARYVADGVSTWHLV